MATGHDELDVLLIDDVKLCKTPTIRFQYVHTCPPADQVFYKTSVEMATALNTDQVEEFEVLRSILDDNVLS